MGAEGGFAVKAACAAVICILAFLSACITGDEITSYVIDPDGSIAFSIYRLNLTSTETGEDAKEDLAVYIRDLEKGSGNLFTKLTEANAKEVKVTILRRTAPASVLIMGRIPSLNDFAVYLSEKDEESSLVCTPISKESVRGFLIEFTRKPSKEKEKGEPGPAAPRADAFSEVRFSLAEGTFTKAQGFFISRDKRSALIDMDTFSKMSNPDIFSLTLSLEWQIPGEAKKQGADL